MKMRILFSSVLTAGLLLTATAQAHDRDRDDYRRHDRHVERHYRGDGDRDYRRYDDSRRYRHHYYYEGYNYYPRYYPRRSYYSYGYPYGYSNGSVTVTIPLY